MDWWWLRCAVPVHLRGSGGDGGGESLNGGDRIVERHPRTNPRTHHLPRMFKRRLLGQKMQMRVIEVIGCVSKGVDFEFGEEVLGDFLEEPL